MYSPSPKHVAKSIPEIIMNHPRQEGDKPTIRNIVLVIQANNEGSTRSIQCFECLGRSHKENQCPNKTALVMRDGEYYSDEEDEEKPIGEEIDSDDDEVDKHITNDIPPTGKFLGVNRRVLSLESLTKQEQRDNLFHTRCLMDGNLFHVVIDGGSCTNLVSLDAVKKLGLSTIKHPHPYNLYWLNDYGAINVNKKAKVLFHIGDAYEVC
ncbi:unnamed protein product [Linum trigynum]|uniref:Uncharacterized protein n=1 Tax=Linum trigynum TaxID=586398 RepID=A0AAV2G536_9ROSI